MPILLRCGRLRFSKDPEEPRQAGIHHRDFGGDGIEPEARERQRGFYSDDFEVCRMHRETNRLGSAEIRSVPAMAASANIKFGTVSATRRE